MTGLILKDFLVMRKTLKTYTLFLAFYAALAALGVFPLSVVTAMVQIILIMLPISAFSYDEFAKWDRYAMTLPLGRRTVVKARYLFTLLMSLGAAALAHRPRLLILDEATAGLDPVVRDEILEEFLAFIQDEEHAILISSHIISDLEKVADYITYLHQGRVALSGTKDDILARYGRVACTAAQLAALEPAELARVRRGSFGCQALVDDRAAFARRHPDLLVEPVSLEDIMLFVGKGESV